MVDDDRVFQVIAERPCLFFSQSPAMKYTVVVLAMCVWCASACNQGDSAEPCEDLATRIINFETEQASSAINNWLIDLMPQPSVSDPLGHEANLQQFADRLRTHCQWEVDVECYGCIETHPLQSHVILSLDSAGIAVQRYLDILTPADAVMTLREIHP